MPEPMNETGKWETCEDCKYNKPYLVERSWGCELYDYECTKAWEPDWNEDEGCYECEEWGMADYDWEY